MRIAVVADIHGNRQAFEAVLEDLKVTSPDLVFHGGDLCDTGSSPVEVVDRIRDLGWPGVVGNTDEILFRPESLREFAGDARHLQTLVTAIEEMAMYAREQLGMARLEWLRSLPRVHVEANVAIVHASPVNLWRAPTQDAGDSDLALTYGPLNRLVSIYGHIHHGFIREIGDKVIANTGSVGLPYDGDPRASYLLLDEARVSLRRVPYDVEEELLAISRNSSPHKEWVARTLRAARPQMP